MARKSSFKFRGGSLPNIFSSSGSSKPSSVSSISKASKASKAYKVSKDVIEARIFRNRRIATGLGLAALIAFYALKAPRNKSSRRVPRPVGRPRSKRRVGRPRAKRRVGRPSLNRRRR